VIFAESLSRGQYIETRPRTWVVCGEDFGGNGMLFGFDAGGGGGSDWYVRTDVMFVIDTRSSVVVFHKACNFFNIVGVMAKVLVE
jgi:hypothetical protein